MGAIGWSVAAWLTFLLAILFLGRGFSGTRFVAVGIMFAAAAVPFVCAVVALVFVKRTGWGLISASLGILNVLTAIMSAAMGLELFRGTGP